MANETFNPADSVEHAAPARLARLISVDDSGEETLAPAELRGILRHQLAAPLTTGLQGILPDYTGVSFSDLLRDEKSPVSLLEQARDYAKRECLVPGGVLPRQIALVLYYACIAAAEAHAHARISSLARADLRRGWLWALDLTWLEDETRQLFVEALSALGSDRGREDCE
jgi:hypothetical protein